MGYSGMAMVLVCLAWATHGQPMGYPRVINSAPMSSQRAIHGLLTSVNKQLMDYLRETHGLPVDCSMRTHGLQMCIPWITREDPRATRELPTGNP